MKHLLTLHLPLESEYKIVQTDASQTGWEGILLVVTNIGEEKLCRYCSGTFNDYQKNLSSTDLEIDCSQFSMVFLRSCALSISNIVPYSYIGCKELE